MTDTPPTDPIPSDPAPPVDPAPVPDPVPTPTPAPTPPTSELPEQIKNGVAALAADLSNISLAVSLLFQHMQQTGAGNVVDPADIAALHVAVDAAATDASNLNQVVNGTPTGSPVPPTPGPGGDLPPGTSPGPTDPPQPVPDPTPDPVPTPTPPPGPPAAAKLSQEDRDRITADQGDIDAAELVIDNAQADIETTLGP